jgi:hypothetical protein
VPANEEAWRDVASGRAPGGHRTEVAHVRADCGDFATRREPSRHRRAAAPGRRGMLDKRQLTRRPVRTENGNALAGELHAATLPEFSKRPCVAEFVPSMRSTSAVNLPQIEPL